MRDHTCSASLLSLSVIGLLLAGCVTSGVRSSPTKSSSKGSSPAETSSAKHDRGARRVLSESEEPRSDEVGRRRALLIANSAYQNETTLKTPKRDVAVMRAQLKRLGYEVQILYDLGGVKLRRAVKAFSRELRSADEVYFHYAGHGLEVNGEAVLLGVDFNAVDEEEVLYQGYHVSAVVSRMSKAKRAVVVIDACRSNPFARSIFGSRDGSAQGLPTQVSIAPRLNQGSGVYLIFSTTRGAVALDGAEVSPFVEAFRAVVNEHGHEPVRDLFSGWVQPRLNKRGQQLTTRTFGTWRSYPLKRPDQSCPEACRPTCNEACVVAIKQVAAARAQLARAEEAKRAEEIHWVKIPSGSFMMGSAHGESNEEPVHRVNVSAFLIAESEVTVRQYRKCVEARVCTKPHTEDQCTWGRSGYDDHPVNCIDWGQARTFSRWVGGDLPTEAQWEYAARGGQMFMYAGSQDASRVGWHEESYTSGSTHPVKQKQKNGYGLYDMSGNVWEWTLDEWHRNYAGAPTDGDRAWGELPACETGCSNGSSKRVNRGGGWANEARSLRVTVRDGDDPALRYSYLGFRPARSVRSIRSAP